MSKAPSPLAFASVADVEFAAAEIDGTSLGLVEAAQEAHEAQEAALDGAELASVFEDALSLQIEAKHHQIERIEDRLESLIELQTGRLNQMMAKRPKLPLPGARAKWQQQQQTQVTSLRRLHERLETVRDIRDDVGLHSSKVDELAMAKLKYERPELVADWQEMKEAERRHQELMRRQNKKDRKRDDQGQSRSSGRVLTRIVSD